MKAKLSMHLTSLLKATLLMKNLCFSWLIVLFILLSSAGTVFAQALVINSFTPAFVEQDVLGGSGKTGDKSFVIEYGYSVAISADGNTAIVGGYYDDSGQGAAWVFTRSGSSWWQQGNKLVGTGNTGAAMQGWSVAISADGNTVIVGGRFDNTGQGAAWVFTRSGVTWSQQGSKLVGSGNTGAAAQGTSVSLSADGNTAIIGGSGDNPDPNDKLLSTGAAWLFTRSGSTWSQQGSKLVGTGNTGAASQGSSVALSADGNTAIVGGPSDNTNLGATWVYTLSAGTWSQQAKLASTGDSFSMQGTSLALSADGNTAIVGGPGDSGGLGAARVWTRSGSTWSQQGSKLVGADNTGAAGQGSSVSLSADGNTAIVGGPFDNTGQGAVWAFVRSGNTWTQQGKKQVDTSFKGVVYFGSSVSVSADGNKFVVGGPNYGYSAGAAWVFSSCLFISNQSTSTQTQCLNGAFRPISVTASGSGQTYQWYSNTSNSSTGGTSLGAGNGAQTNTYTPQATATGFIYYYCVVTGDCGYITSAVSGAFITLELTVILSQSTATQAQCYDGAFTPISVTATGSGTLTYQWYSNTVCSKKGGTDIWWDLAATHTSTYTPQTNLPWPTLYYYCVVTGACGTDTSAV